jgi:hypothetical protein
VREKTQLISTTTSLRSFIVASLPLDYKEILESASWCTHQVLNHSKWTKNEEDTGLTLERSLELFFQNKLKQIWLIPLVDNHQCGYITKLKEETLH